MSNLPQATQVLFESWPEDIYMLIFGYSYSATYWQQEVTFYTYALLATQYNIPLCANHNRNILKHASNTYYVLKDAINTMKQEVAVTQASNVRSGTNVTHLTRVLS